MANADTPEDALAARKNGAQGIGLCRTEHMVNLFPCLGNIFFIFQSVSSAGDFYFQTYALFKFQNLKRSRRYIFMIRVGSLLFLNNILNFLILRNV